jgi:hypothetical protein
MCVWVPVFCVRVVQRGAHLLHLHWVPTRTPAGNDEDSVDEAATLPHIQPGRRPVGGVVTGKHKGTVTRVEGSGLTDFSNTPSDRK